MTTSTSASVPTESCVTMKFSRLSAQDACSTGTHLNDITLIAPVYYPGEPGGRPVGYLATLAHHVDVGGGAPASLGAFQEIYQEGIIIPPTLLLEDGEIIDNVFRLIVANIRSPKQIGGDLRAQVAAATLGKKRVCSLHERFGSETVLQFNDQLMDYTNRWTKRAIAQLPPVQVVTSFR